MNTYFLARESIEAFAKDFLRRLDRLETFPEVWCPITKSGDVIASVLTPLLPRALLGKVQLLPIGVARDAESTKVSFLGGDDAHQVVSGKSVLLLDGAIHSGHTMNRCAEEIGKLNPQDMASYALVTKAGASFVPTFWSVTIDETDRAFFLLDEIPNNRLDAELPGKKQTPVHIERLDRRHVDRPPVTSGVKSMDRPTWSDRLFQMQVSDHSTYLLIRGTAIVGYLTIHFAGDKAFIDEVAVDKGLKGRGYGGVLMRFADTMARQTNCRVVVLNGIDEQVGFYENLSYRKVAEAAPLILDDEKYWPMSRAVLYHQRHR